MDPLLNRIATRLEIDDRKMANFYMSGTCIPEVETIVARLDKETTFDQLFPFYAFCMFMDIHQCEMFLRAMSIAFFKHGMGIVTRRPPLHDKAQFYVELASMCDSDKGCTLFIKTVNEFV